MEVHGRVYPRPSRLDPEAACDNIFCVTSAWQTTVLMDSWLKHKLAENSMMFGHRVGAIPTNVIDANRRYLV